MKKIVSRTRLQIHFVGGRKVEGYIYSLNCWANKDQIEDVDHAIAIGVRGGFTETVGNLKHI